MTSSGGAATGTFLWPTFLADDPRALLTFLVEAFGFRELVVYGDGDRVDHAELAGPRGGGVMFGAAREGSDAHSAAPGTVASYVVVDDTDALFARAVAAGAVVVREPYDTDYGSRDCLLRDPEGNRWSFGTYAGHPG